MKPLDLVALFAMIIMGVALVGLGAALTRAVQPPSAVYGLEPPPIHKAGDRLLPEGQQ